MQPERGEEGCQDRHLDDYPPLAADAGHALDHLAVGHDLGTTEVVALADRLSLPATPARYRTVSASAIGCVGVETQRGATIAGRRSTKATMVSNAALPLPTTTAARSVVSGTAPDASARPVSACSGGAARVLALLTEPTEVDDLAAPAISASDAVVRAPATSRSSKSGEPSE